MIVKLFQRIEAAILNVCIVCMIIQIVAVSIVVFGRTVLSKTPGWGEETALLGMVWFSMLSAALAVRNDKHIRITLIEQVLSKKANKILDFSVFILIILYSLFLIIIGVRYTAMSIPTVMSGIGISMGFIAASVPATGLSILILTIGKVRELLCQPK